MSGLYSWCLRVHWGQPVLESLPAGSMYMACARSDIAQLCSTMASSPSNPGRSLL